MSILCTLERFSEVSLPEIRKSKDILEEMSKTVLPLQIKCPTLKCINTLSENHIEKLCRLILEKILRPVLTNFASHITEREQVHKNINNKPLSRKVLTL